MKLRTKIFISILLVSLSTLSISSYYLINRSHLDNIGREQERSMNEFTFLVSSMENGLDFTTYDDNLKLLLSRYVSYYAGRGIQLQIYHNNELYYSEFTKINESKYQKLLSVSQGTRQAQVISEKNQHYFFVTGRSSENSDFVFVYIRDISNIYQLRSQSVYLSLLVAATLILVLSFLSYLYSRWITSPIEVLNKGANSISEGNYSVRVPITKDEFGTLGAAFNQMATAVEARRQELEEKAKELQEFIDDLSHEMNTPLTSIQGYSEFLLNAKTTEEQKQKAAETIRMEAKRMKDIYTKLMILTLAREQQPEFTNVAIGDLLQELADSFSLQLQEYQINLSIENKLTTLFLDRILIHMLLSNLIKNSIQALPNGGDIRLIAHYEDSHPTFEVSDNGYGIPKDKINEVSKPFYRVDKSRSRKTGGAGLGLSICKSIASLHQAALIITSEEGKGTSVKIIFYNSVTTS